MFQTRYLSVAAALISLASPVVASDTVKLNLKKQLNLPRVIGGITAQPGERPWMASLQSQGEHFCGGSLIAQEWVLTAAHCVEDLTEQDRGDLRVRVNLTDLGVEDEANTHAVQTVVMHPDYSANQGAADVALLRLSTPVSASVPTLALATPGLMAAEGQPGTMTTVSGWGNTSVDGESYPRELRQVNVPIVANEVCNGKESYGGDVQPTELCAGYPQGGKDSCQGDSGGPLVLEASGGYHQVGIVSWGDGCALPNKYGVYARVSSFYPWITNVMANQSGGDASPPRGTLQSGVLVAGLKARAGESLRFTITVPQGSRILWLDTKGGRGDADLYLRRGAAPTLEEYDYAPFKNGNREQVLVRRPKAGVWHVMVDGYDDFEGVELMGFTR